MKFLFVTYCMGPAYGQMQIGVYKRGLRVALELTGRGHQVYFFCTGRHNFEDAHTAVAARTMQFIDIPFQPPRYEAAVTNRAVYLAWMKEHQPDVVVIGEAPMAGTMLEATLTAVEAGIPTVMLDNAYHPARVGHFLRMHAPIVDGVLLMGPSALQGRTTYPYLLQVPPLIEVSLPKTRLLLEDIGLSSDMLLLILAYDRKVEQLGLSLITKLDEPDLVALFITPDRNSLRDRLTGLPAAVVDRIRIIPPPNDEVLFGLLQIARCAVTKCAFMQVTESLTLHTPVIGLYYQGDFSVGILPRTVRAFAHMTSHVDADVDTVKAARRFLRMGREQLTAVHDGSLGAAAKAADFLESIPRSPRTDTTAEVGRVGFSLREVQTAIARLEKIHSPKINQVRSTYLRQFPNHQLHVLLCDYSVNGTRGVARLWGRIFRWRLDLFLEAQRARADGSRRHLLAVSIRRRTLLEVDLGEEVLPSIKDLQQLEG